MKEFIAGTIIIVFFMGMFVQFGTNQLNHTRMTTVNNIVHAAAQEARSEGCFTEGNIQDIKTKIADYLSFSEDEIIVDVLECPERKYRFSVFDEREMIPYYIGIPIKRIIAAYQFYNIEEADNSFIYPVSGEVASEVLAP